MKSRDDIFAEINKERARQDKKWAPTEYDASYNQIDWRIMIRNRVNEFPRGDFGFRDMFIEVAALCVAALESDIKREGIDVSADTE